MTVYGPRLYYGPLDAPDTPSDDSSCSRGTVKSHPPREEPMTDLTWIKSNGHHQAETDPHTGVQRWVIAHTADRRWEIISITAEMERRRHGAAYTLREAKEIIGNFHRSNVLATQKGA